MYIFNNEEMCVLMINVCYPKLLCLRRNVNVGRERQDKSIFFPPGFRKRFVWWVILLPHCSMSRSVINSIHQTWLSHCKWWKSEPICLQISPHDPDDIAGCRTAVNKCNSDLQRLLTVLQPLGTDLALRLGKLTLIDTLLWPFQNWCV